MTQRSYNNKKGEIQNKKIRRIKYKEKVGSVTSLPERIHRRYQTSQNSIKSSRKTNFVPRNTDLVRRAGSWLECAHTLWREDVIIEGSRVWILVFYDFFNMPTAWRSGQLPIEIYYLIATICVLDTLRPFVSGQFSSTYVLPYLNYAWFFCSFNVCEIRFHKVFMLVF